MFNKTFHRCVRWGLGIHGSFHVIETVVNIYEKAYISAILSFLAGILMIAGALINLSYDKNGEIDESI